MTKNTRLLPVVGLAGLLLSAAGCKEDVFGVDDGVRVPVEIKMSVAAVEIQAATRAADGFNSTSGFTISATAADNQVGINAGGTDYVYTFSGTAGESTTSLTDPATKPYFPAGSTSVAVYGWYPQSCKTSVTVQSDQSSRDNYLKSDLMLAQSVNATRSGSGSSWTNNPALLTFRHALAKIKVAVTAQGGITVNSVKVHALPTFSGYNASAATPGGTASGTTTDITVMNGSGTGVCVIPPQDISGTFLTVNVTPSGGSATDVTYTMASAKTVVGNGVYELILTLNLQDIALGNITITDWDFMSATNFANDGSGVLNVKPVAVDLGLSVKWADINVGAMTESDYGQYFMWGNVPALPNEIGEVADQWYDANATYKYTKYISDYATLHPVDDAATVTFGGYWRMPTMAEFTELAATKDNTNYEWVWQTDYKHSGHAGWLITYKGVTPNTSIFLPAAGGRGRYDDQNGGGKLICDGECFYWTSTLGAMQWGEYGAACRFLFEGMDSYGSRNYGASVRAVYDEPYVDLGLPSGTKWAKKNVGAASETDYGLYFMWGDVAGHPGVTTDGFSFAWANYKWGTSSSSLTKYTSTDGKATLEAADDAATANWGSGWRMPTKAEFEELLNNTTKAWTSNYNGSGVAGYTFTANGQTLFLPAAGSRNGTNVNYQGSGGLYWSSTLFSSYPPNAWCLNFNENNAYVIDRYGDRYLGYSVRPVQ